MKEHGISNDALEKEADFGDVDCQSAELVAANGRSISRRSFLAGTAALAATLLLSTGCTSSDNEDEGDGDSSVENSAEAESEAATEEEEGTDNGFPVTVTDLSGYEVTIESQPQSIGALLGGSYSFPFLLGAADRVSCRMAIDDKAAAWSAVVDPNYETYDTVDFESSTARDPNMEELAELGVDLVYYWAGLDEQKENMEAIGITVLEASATALGFTTVEEWRELTKQQVNLYGDTLGGGASEKAAEWCTYTDEKIDMVVERTADLSDDERPTVYCIRNQEDGLQCFAMSSQFSMLVEAAGGTLVSKDIETDGSGYTTVTIEQVAGWNPEIIFMGWLEDTTLITENEQWASFDAVVNDQVYTVPCSLTTTDWAFSPEVAIETIYVAQILHPDLFDDIDIIEEIQEFYSTFYDCDLSEEQAQAMIDREYPPEE